VVLSLDHIITADLLPLHPCNHRLLRQGGVCIPGLTLLPTGPRWDITHTITTVRAGDQSIKPNPHIFYLLCRGPEADLLKAGPWAVITRAVTTVEAEDQRSRSDCYGPHNELSCVRFYYRLLVHVITPLAPIPRS
jgi:hypothetical protein